MDLGFRVFGDSGCGILWILDSEYLGMWEFGFLLDLKMDRVIMDLGIMDLEIMDLGFMELGV